MWLGLVLGGTLDNQYGASLILNDNSHQGFLDTEVAFGFLALTLLMIGLLPWSARQQYPAHAGARASCFGRPRDG